jgi:hypothetical protein
MALKALLDSTAHGALAPELQSEYAAVGDGFVLQVEDDIRDHPKVKALKVALDRMKVEKKTMTDRLTELDAKLEGLPDDFDAEQYARDQDELTQLRDKLKKKKPGEDDEEGLAQKRLYEQRIENLTTKHNTEKGRLEDEKKALMVQIERLVADEGLTKALVAAGVEKKLMPGATALLRGKVKVKKENDSYIGYFDTDLGESSIDDYVSNWAQSDEGTIYIAKAKGGDGTGSEGTKFPDNPWDNKGGTVKPNLTRQQEMIKSHPDRARQMANAAGVTPTW